MATSPAASAAFGFGTPFFEQIEFFRRKLNLPTDAWDDIKRSAHDRAFIVAGAAKADLLQDLRGAMDSAMASGGIAEFRKQFKAVVAQHGWTGWKGEGSPAGVAWRTRIIYQTNMATSYAAGRYQQLTEPGFAKRRPFWKYVHADGLRHPRPLHLAWNGLTLPLEHPFWKTHFAPNGWGCRCEIHPVAAPAAGAATEPPAGWDQIDPHTGAPPGIDKGFDYTPGANVHTPLQTLVDQKLIKLDAPMGAAMWQALKPALAMERQAAWWETLDTWLASPAPIGRTAVVGTLDTELLGWLQSNGHEMPLTAEIAIREGLVVGAKQQRHMSQQTGLLLDEWRALPALLDQPGNIYRDTSSGKLIFVADGIGPTKAAVEFDPKKTKQGLNELSTAFRVSAVDVAGMVKGLLWELIR